MQQQLANFAQQVPFEVFSPPSGLDMDDLDDSDKMTRAQWLMAHCDLDPIESRGSMETSTHNTKRGPRSERAVQDGSKSAAELARASKPPKDRQQTAQGNKRSKPVEKLENPKSHNSYESKYTLIDISEEKMRNFVMS